MRRVVEISIDWVRSRPFATIVQWSCALLFAVTFVVIAVISVLRPTIGWDTLPYAALALQENGDTDAVVHARAYDGVRDAYSPSITNPLVNGDGYRRRQTSDAEAFASMLPMYAVKAGYVAVLKPLTQLFGVRTALHIMGVSAIALLGSLLMVWTCSARATLALPFILFVALSLQLREQTSAGMPDLWATTLIVAAFWALMQDRDWFSIPLLVAATAFRPDTLVVAFAIVVAFAATGSRLRWVFTAFASCIATYLASRWTLDTVGWWTHYSFSNVRIVDTLVGFEPPFSIPAYLKGQLRGALNALAYFHWPFVASAILCGWYAAVRFGVALGVRINTLLLACVLATGGKFVLFPLPDDRIHAAPVLSAAVILLTAVVPRFRPVPPAARHRATSQRT